MEDGAEPEGAGEVGEEVESGVEPDDEPAFEDESDVEGEAESLAGVEDPDEVSGFDMTDCEAVWEAPSVAVEVVPLPPPPPQAVMMNAAQAHAIADW
ncbi:hypothetical protein [Noviherbaspirillum massiliense]|uniref:hypothetical protein n=1 Tax=Noviherbaspirillum massiliense TaxID=1465823 RepID=UPI001FE1A940|nr:hypothetical protein [Noviherbaspirillum massiliense]